MSSLCIYTGFSYICYVWLWHFVLFQVWWVKSVLWTSWWPKRLNVGRKLLPTPNWSLLWPKRLLMQVCNIVLLRGIFKLSKSNNRQCCLTCSFVLLQLMNWLWLRVTVWKSVYSTLPLPRWEESQSEGGVSSLVLAVQSWRVYVYVFPLQDDRKEGMTAFVEKRKASFQDK